jgi:hypothetical protein
MAVLRRLVFYWGVLLGLFLVAAAGAVALTYLFTGKFPSVDMEAEQPEVTLMTSDEWVAFVREQVDKAKASAQPVTTEGGETDDIA